MNRYQQLITMMALLATPAWLQAASPVPPHVHRSGVKLMQHGAMQTRAATW